jgi:hypothetical protein
VRIRHLQWTAVGVVLIIIHGLLVPLSWEFEYDAPVLTYPIISFVALEMLAGGVYLTLLWLIPRSRSERRLLALVLGVGLTMRAVTMFSTPILEDDFYRYLWDGAVVAEGKDPYRYSPAQVLAADSAADSASELAALSMLSNTSTPVAQRINYPELTTVYPPLTQGVFALGASIEAFSLKVWRLILLLIEGATVVLLYLILRQLNRSPLWLAIYWWNPLAVKELVNSAHMDALLLPLLAGIVLLMLMRKGVLASLCLALAAGVKLWPALLLPTVLRPLVAEPAKLVAALAVFLAAFSGTAWWLFRQVGGETGLTSYFSNWNMNDAFFLALHWAVGNALELLDYDWLASGSVTRALVAATILWLGLWLNRRVAVDPGELCSRFLVLTAVVFLLSPTQFPWYYTWLLPFLVVAPSPALLLLTALLPLYYLRFYLDFRDQTRLFDHGIVWLEYLPVWLLLAREWWMPVHRRSAARLDPGRS